MATNYNQAQSDKALASLPEEISGIADEIVSENGYAVFRFGGFDYKLWWYGILNGHESEVISAVKMAETYYREKLGQGKKDKDNG